MLGPLGVTFACGEGDSGGAFAADLQRTLRLRCAEAWDLPRVRTMLSWWEPFLLASGRAPWVPALELPGMIWNRMTLDLFGEFIRRSPPLGKARGDKGAELELCWFSQEPLPLQVCTPHLSLSLARARSFCAEEQ